MTDTIQASLDKHVQKYAKYYTPDILKPAVHFRLVEDIKRIASKSKVPEHFIYKVRLDKVCTVEVVQHIKDFPAWKDGGIAGMVFVNASDVEDKMLSIAGAFIRNFINARVLTVQEVITRVKDGDPPDNTVVLIPNFHLPSHSGGSIPDWQVSMLLGWLSGRYAEGLQTILAVKDMHQMATQYGEFMAEHIENHYYRVN